MKKILAAGITNEAVSAEDAMEQMIKEKTGYCRLAKVLLFMIQMGKS